MNVKTTIVLAVVLLVVVGAFLMFKPKAATVDTKPSDQEEKKSKPLYELDQLVKFEVDKPGKEKLVFERPAKEGKKGEYEDWRIVEPIKAKVTNWEVSSFADKFKSPKYKEKFTPGQAGYPTADKISIDKPKAIVTVTDAKGTTKKIEIGDKVFGGSETYIKLAGANEAYVVDLDVREDIKKDVTKFRSKDLLDYDKDKVVQADVVHDGKTYSLVKSGDGWVIDQPTKAPADKSKIDSFLSDLKFIRADDFIEDAPKTLTTFGLDKPKTTVTLTLEEKIEEKKEEAAQTTQPTSTQAAPKIKRSKVSVAFGGASDLKGEKFYCKPGDQPWVVSVSKSDYEKAQPKLDQWREAKVTQAKVLDAQKIELTSAEGRVVLEKDGESWKIAAPAAGKAENSAVTDLLNAINDLKASDWVDQPQDKKEYGLDKPAVEIVLVVKGSTAAERILVGGNTQSGLLTYVHQAASPSIAVVKLDAAKKLQVSPLSFRDRSILHFAKSRADQIELARQGATVVLVKQKDTWKMTQPVAADADTDAIDSLLSDLCSLKAGQIVGEGDPAKYSLDKPGLKVSVTVQPPPPESRPTTTSAPTTTGAAATATALASAPATKPAPPAKPTIHVLLVSKKGEKVYAMVQGGKLVYELPDSVYKNLTAEPHDRKPLKFETSQATAVEVVGGDVEKPLKFAKANDKWTYTPDPHLAIDEQKVKDLITALHDLKAERYESYAAADLKPFGLDAPALTVTLKTESNKTITMRLSAADKDGNRKAAIEAEPGKTKVFVVTKADVEKFAKKVGDFAKA